MRWRMLSCLLVSVFFVPLLEAQDQPRRDLQAIAVLRQSITVMGGAAPNDSLATGTATSFVPGEVEVQNIRILTRGLVQYREAVDSPNTKRTLTVSNGQVAASDDKTMSRSLPINARNSIGALFPLARLLVDLTSGSIAIEYVGTEQTEGALLHHLRIWDTFASESDSDMRQLSSQTVREVWIDAATYLPRKLTYFMFSGSAPNAPIPVEINYSSYGRFGAFLYPTRMLKNFNGSPFASIEIQQVQFNTGLSDSDFPVKKENPL